MPYEIIKKSAQIPGAFNGGAIQENRPMIPGYGAKAAPFSNLFYWAHAWSEEGSLLGEHPHEAFEIMTFVLRGKIEHYDSHTKGWKPIEAGGAQIIRAGTGLSHAEKFFPGAHIFQIWFDPNLEETLKDPPSYNDYTGGDFPVSRKNGIEIKTYRGQGSPLEMKSPGLEILEYTFPNGVHTITLDNQKIRAFYVVEGECRMNGEKLEPDDFWKVEGEKEVALETFKNTRVFSIGALKQLPYVTYLERTRNG